MVGENGFEPLNLIGTDLQSACFSHLHTRPYNKDNFIAPTKQYQLLRSVLRNRTFKSMSVYLFIYPRMCNIQSNNLQLELWFLTLIISTMNNRDMVTLGGIEPPT